MIVAPYVYPVLGNIKFVIRSDNSIKVDIDGTLSGSLVLGNYDPLHGTINHIQLISNITPQLYEIHKLKKIEQ